MSKHIQGPVFISKDQVQQLNEKHGWFQFGDAQSDVSNAFANEAIERYERIRAAAPELLEGLKWHRDALDLGDVAFYERHGFNVSEVMPRTRAIVKKAEGEQQ